MNDRWTKQMSNDEGQLVNFRLEQLEKQFTNMHELIQETHDAVTSIKSRMGNDSVLQCNVHAERLKSIEGRLVEIESDRKDQNKEIESLKKFMWKLVGGLALAAVLFNNILAPTILDWLKPKSDASSKQHTELVHTNLFNFSLR